MCISNWSGVVVALALAVGSSARAASTASSYCRKVQARTAGEAALHFAPTLQVQGIQFPQTGTIDAGVTIGRGLQMRAGLSFSLLDFYRGFRLLRAGDADCDQHAALLDVEQLFTHLEELGRLAALRDEAAVLEGANAALAELSATNDERLRAGIITLGQALELRTRIAEIARRRVHVAGEIERLAANDLAVAGAPLALTARADRAIVRYEREISHLRTLDAWTLSVAGGVVPHAEGVDSFAVLQLGFNVGGIARYVYEARYLAARQEELRSARYELHENARRFRAQLAALITRSRRELALVEDRRSSLRSIRAALDQADARSAPHALALVRIDLILLDAEAAYLTRLVDELANVAEGTRGE